MAANTICMHACMYAISLARLKYDLHLEQIDMKKKMIFILNCIFCKSFGLN